MSQGGEKTEKATAKKRRDAREKGQVRHSTEVNTTFCLLVMFGTLLIIWPWFTERLMDIFREYLGFSQFDLAMGGMTQNEVGVIYTRVLMSILGAIFPILGAALVAGIAVNIIQIGFLFTTKPLGMKLNRISPLSGF